MVLGKKKRKQFGNRASGKKTQNICQNISIKCFFIIGVKTFFLLLLGVLACFACVVIGIMIYQKQQENSRKRFY